MKPYKEAWYKLLCLSGFHNLKPIFSRAPVTWAIAGQPIKILACIRCDKVTGFLEAVNEVDMPEIKMAKPE